MDVDPRGEVGVVEGGKLAVERVLNREGEEMEMEMEGPGGTREIGEAIADEGDRHAEELELTSPGEISDPFISPESSSRSEQSTTITPHDGTHSPQREERAPVDPTNATIQRQVGNLVSLSSPAYVRARIQMLVQLYLYNILLNSYVLHLYAFILQMFSGFGYGAGSGSNARGVDGQ